MGVLRKTMAESNCHCLGTQGLSELCSSRQRSQLYIAGLLLGSRLVSSGLGTLGLLLKGRVCVLLLVIVAISLIAIDLMAVI